MGNHLRLVHSTPPTAILRPIDRYARDRGIRGATPAPIGPVEFLMTGRVVGGNFEPFSAQRQLQVVKNSDGYFIHFDQFVERDPGNVVTQLDLNARKKKPSTVLRTSLDDGVYRLEAISHFYQVDRRDAQLPSNDPVVFELEPSTTYPFPSAQSPSAASPTLLRGAVYDVTGRGIPGVAVEVSGRSNTFATDASGQWVLVFPDDDAGGDVAVHFSFPDGSAQDITPVTAVRGQSRSLHQAGLRGSVLDETGKGLAGATITVTGAGNSSVSNGEGRFYYYFPLGQGAVTVNVTATLPDGSSRTRFNVDVVPRAVVVVPSFRFN